MIDTSFYIPPTTLHTYNFLNKNKTLVRFFFLEEKTRYQLMFSNFSLNWQKLKMNAHVIKANTHSTTMLIEAKEEKVRKNGQTTSPRGLENHSQWKAIGTQQKYMEGFGQVLICTATLWPCQVRRVMMRNIHKHVNSEYRYLVVKMIERNSFCHRFLRETFNWLHTLYLTSLHYSCAFSGSGHFSNPCEFTAFSLSVFELDNNKFLFTSAFLPILKPFFFYFYTWSSIL